MRRLFPLPFLLLLSALDILKSNRFLANDHCHSCHSQNADEAQIIRLGKVGYPETIVTQVAISNRYGLYIWIDGEMRGETIVKYDQSSKLWNSVGGTRGAFRVEDMMRFGVPQETAQKLVDEIKQQIQDA